MNVEKELRDAGAAFRRSLGADAPDGVVPVTGDRGGAGGFDPDDAADAAELGEAAYILGVHYVAAGNLSAAARWLRIAAQRDIGDAPLRLALVLRMQALDCAGDDDEASLWFEAASAAGYTDDADQLDAPALPVSCCPSPADEAATADALQRAEEIIRSACAEAEKIVAAAREQANTITAAARRQAHRIIVAEPRPTRTVTAAATQHCLSYMLTRLATFGTVHHNAEEAGSPPRPWTAAECALALSPLCDTSPDRDHLPQLGSLWYELAQHARPLAFRSSCTISADSGQDAWLLLDADATPVFHKWLQAKWRSAAKIPRVNLPRWFGDLHLDCEDVLVADSSDMKRLLAEYDHDVVSVSTKVSQIKPGQTTTNDQDEERTELAAFEVLMAAPAAA